MTVRVSGQSRLKRSERQSQARWLPCSPCNDVGPSCITYALSNLELQHRQLLYERRFALQQAEPSASIRSASVGKREMSALILSGYRKGGRPNQSELKVECGGKVSRAKRGALSYIIIYVLEIVLEFCVRMAVHFSEVFKNHLRSVVWCNGST